MIFTGLAKLVCPVISFSVRAVKNLQCQTGTQVSCPMNPSQLSFCQTFYQKHQEIDEIKSHLKCLSPWKTYNKLYKQGVFIHRRAKETTKKFDCIWL